MASGASKESPKAPSPISNEDADMLVELFTLPPNKDRHEAFLRRHGFLVDQHLSWKRLSGIYDRFVVSLSIESTYIKGVCFTFALLC
jgi:hypothetical protein